MGEKWHLSKSIIPSEAPQCFGEYVQHVGINDGKVSAGELKLQAGGDVPT